MAALGRLTEGDLAWRGILAQAALATALSAAFYLPGLDVSPPHLLHDEIKPALQAKSLADTGRDLNGRLLPLYFPEPGFSVGRDPILIYVTAAWLTILPLSDVSIRVPSAIIGAVGVGLTFVLARLLFPGTAVAWMTAGLIALTPIYYIHSRFALSVLYPVPFTLLWLVLIARYQAQPARRLAVACGLVLGLGMYSYLGAVLLMPLYLAATMAVCGVRHDRRSMAASAAAFLVLMAPLALWQSVEPDRYRNMLTAYRLYDPDQLSASEKLRELVSLPSVRLRVDTFWDALNPARLFITGESSLHISTREVGSFLLPVVVLLGFGIRRLVHDPTVMGIILLFGLLTAPLPAVVMADAEIRRWLVVVPFVVVIAACGADGLLERGGWARTVCVGLLVLMPVQFVAFGRDYFGRYPERASFWFGGNIRGALETVIDHADTDAAAGVFISREIPWVDAYWRFYTAVHGRLALLEHTRYVSLQTRDEVPAATPGFLVVAPAADEQAASLLVQAGWSRRHVVRDLDGKPSYAIYAKSGA